MRKDVQDGGPGCFARNPNQNRIPDQAHQDERLEVGASSSVQGAPLAGQPSLVQHIDPKVWLMQKALRVACGTKVESTSSIRGLKRIGEGTYGVVERGFVTGWGDVCVKTYKPSNLGKWTECCLELSMLTHLTHPNVISVLDVCAENPPRIIMPWGGTALKNLLYDDPYRKHPFPEWRTLTAQLFSGLEYIHKCNVVHADLKPANVVMMAENGQVQLRIIDFGCSFFDQAGIRTLQTREEIVKSGLEYGTLYYRSPEVLFGDPMFGKPLDVWAGACTVAEFFRDRPLFFANQTKSVVKCQFHVLGVPPKRALDFLMKLPLAEAHRAAHQRQKRDPTTFAQQFASPLPDGVRPWFGELFNFHPLMRATAASARLTFTKIAYGGAPA